MKSGLLYGTHKGCQVEQRYRLTLYFLECQVTTLLGKLHKALSLQAMDMQLAHRPLTCSFCKSISEKQVGMALSILQYAQVSCVERGDKIH